MKKQYLISIIGISLFIMLVIIIPIISPNDNTNTIVTNEVENTNQVESESQDNNDIEYSEEEKKEQIERIKRHDYIVKKAKSLKPEQLAKEVYSEVIPILKEGLEMDILRQQDKIECMPIMRRLIPVTDDLRLKAEQLPEKYLGLKAITVNLGLCIRCNQSAQEFCDIVSEDLEHLDSNYIWN